MKQWKLQKLQKWKDTIVLFWSNWEISVALVHLELESSSRMVHQQTLKERKVSNANNHLFDSNRQLETENRSNSKHLVSRRAPWSRVAPDEPGIVRRKSLRRRSEPSKRTTAAFKGIGVAYLSVDRSVRRKTTSHRAKRRGEARRGPIH